MSSKITKFTSRRETETASPLSESAAVEPHQPFMALVCPEFIRLTKSGTRCPWSRLSRSAQYEVILRENPPVKSVVIRRPGATRGIRLIQLRSLLDHLHAQPSTTESTKKVTQAPKTQKMNELYMIRKQSPNRTIGGGGGLGAAGYRLLLSKQVSNLRGSTDEELCAIIHESPDSRRGKAAQIILDERIAQFPPKKPDKT